LFGSTTQYVSTVYKPTSLCITETHQVSF